MVEILIVLYIVAGVGAAAYVAYMDRKSYFLNVATLVVAFMFWPLYAFVYTFEQLVSWDIRNPFWRRSK